MVAKCVWRILPVNYRATVIHRTSCEGIDLLNSHILHILPHIIELATDLEGPSCRFTPVTFELGYEVYFQ